MPDVFDTITNFINSPPGQLAAGGVLAGIVWKFFERVEALLTDNTKLEIAVWLLDRKKLSPTFQSWPDTFAKVFDRLFTEKHLSFRCFFRSGIVSILMSALGAFLWTYEHSSVVSELIPSLPGLLLICLFCSVPIDYISLLKARLLIGKTAKTDRFFVLLVIVALEVSMTMGFAWIGMQASERAVSRLRAMGIQTPVFEGVPIPLSEAHKVGDRIGIFIDHDGVATTFVNGRLISKGQPQYWYTWFYPAFFTSIWFCLYAASGFLLKAARRFRYRLRVVQQEVRHREEALAIYRPRGRSSGGGGVLGGSDCEYGGVALVPSPLQVSETAALNQGLQDVR